MLWLEIKIRLLTLVARFLLYFASLLWALRADWAFHLHQKIGWIVVDWYHKYKHIHKMEIWDEEDDL
jgi:hypothetical protein